MADHRATPHPSPRAIEPDPGMPAEPYNGTEPANGAVPTNDAVPTNGASFTPAVDQLADEVVTCPECGTKARVTLNRRESVDFCRNCDYPLFWTPSTISYNRSGETAESLRRLPGTVGRVTVASLSCPRCAEPNALSAQVCVRCGGPMHPVVAVAPPPPVYVAPPPPEPEPEPERGVPWWVWVLLVVGVLAIVAVVVLAVTHTFG